VLTRRGLGLLVTAVGLWAGARTFGIPELQMLAVGGLALVAIAVLVATLTSTQLEVDRIARPGRLSFGERAEVTLTMRNPGRLPTLRLEVRDQVPAALTDRPRARIGPIPGGGRLTASYTITGWQRGRHQLGPLEVVLSDPFGLAARRRTIAGTAPVTVYPPVWELPPGLPLAGSSTNSGTGRRPRPSGDELADVREYVRGDDLRAVHWPSTAHRGVLMVRQSDSPYDPRAVVLLDIDERRHTGSGAHASIETAVAVAASAGYHLTSRGRAVVLLDRPLTAPARALPWETWLESLAALTPERVDLGALLRQVGKGAAGDGTLIAIVTPPDAIELRGMVLAGRGFSTRIAIIIDTHSHQRGAANSDDGTAAAAALTTAGWRTTIVRRGDRIDQQWRELLAAGRVPAGIGAPT
jgi:hypothetical protein